MTTQLQLINIIILLGKQIGMRNLLVIVAFHNFANAPKNALCIFYSWLMTVYFVGCVTDYSILDIP